MGQTEQGSFIASIICPFVNNLDGDEVYEMGAYNTKNELNNSITRSITKKYINSVYKLKNIVENDSYMSFFDSENDDNISMNFVESIVELTEFNENNVVEIIPVFSSYVNSITDVPKSITLTKDYVDPLKSVVKKHILKYEHPEKSYIGKLSCIEASPVIDERDNVEVDFHFIEYADLVTKARVILSKEYINEVLNAFMIGADVIITGILKINGKNKIFQYSKFKTIKTEELV